MPADALPSERIAKRLARAGICSRREAEALVLQKRVMVNGKVITSPALNVTLADTILVDGEPLPKADLPRLWKYYKPKGEICSHNDPQKRKTIFQTLETHYPHLPRVISVGRLDYNSEGLLLLTNSGTLARYMELPATGWVRRYKIRVHGKPSAQKLANLKEGITVDGIQYGSIDAVLEDQQNQSANYWLKVALKEGKNREIRRVMEHLGYPVNRLIRLSYGPFQLGQQKERSCQEIPEKTLKEQFGKKWTDF